MVKKIRKILPAIPPRAPLLKQLLPTVLTPKAPQAVPPLLLSIPPAVVPLPVILTIPVIPQVIQPITIISVFPPTITLLLKKY